MLSEQELDNLAKLVRLDLAPAEKTGLQKDLSAILGYVDELKKLKDKPAPSEAGRVNILRADEPRPWPSEKVKELIGAFPERSGDYLKVKAIIDYDQRRR